MGLKYGSSDVCLEFPEDAQTWVFRAGEDLLYLASSLERNAQTLAPSSGWPILDSGTRPIEHFQLTRFHSTQACNHRRIEYTSVLVSAGLEPLGQIPTNGTMAFGQVARGSKSAIPSIDNDVKENQLTAQHS